MTGPQRTAGGVLGKIAGRFKRAAGTAVGDEELAREGRLQEASTDAEADARRDAAQARRREARSDLAEQQRASDEERRRLENEVAADRRIAAIERDRSDADAEAAALEQRARDTERAADTMDPEER